MPLKDNSKVLITGASGMLGQSLIKKFPESVALLGRSKLNLLNKGDVLEWFGDKNFDTIIHSAAITNLKKSNQNPQESLFLHAEIIKEVLQERCKKIIYISTVPVWEKENYNDSCVYFRTKRAGEHNTLLNSNNLVIRTNIYGDGGLCRWALDNLKLGNTIYGYTNSIFNPVHVDQLSDVIEKALEENFCGLRTICSDKIMSKYDFLHRALKIWNFPEVLLKKTELEEKQNLILNNDDIQLSFDKGVKKINELF